MLRELDQLSFQVANLCSAKQFEHQLKRWGVKKYRKGDQPDPDSLNHSPEQEKSQQVNGSSPSSVTQVAGAGSSDNADAEAVYSPSNGTRGTDKAPESVNGDERVSQTGYMSESPPATCVSPEKSIDKRSPTSEVKLPTNSVGLHEIKAVQPQLSESIDPELSNPAS